MIGRTNTSGGNPLNFKESTEYPGCYYRTVDGVTEWLNPPMVMGTEYRTTERFKNETVYVKAINFGTLPNATMKEVSTGLSGVKGIVDVRMTLYSTANAAVVVDNGDTKAACWLENNHKTAVFMCNNDRTYATGTMFVKYIKS